VYSIGNSGVLTLLPGAPVGAGTGPNGISIDSTDSFVYVVNGGSGNVSGFLFSDQTGILTSVAGSPFNAGPYAAGIATSPVPKK